MSACRPGRNRLIQGSINSFLAVQLPVTNLDCRWIVDALRGWTNNANRGVSTSPVTQSVGT